MQSGSSRELLELWAPDARNGLIITGYSIEGTMARVSDLQVIGSGLSTFGVLYVLQQHEKCPLSLPSCLSLS